MKVSLGIERWTIHPETLEEYIIFIDYLNRLPKVTVKWDTVSDIMELQKQLQTAQVQWGGMVEFPYMILDFDPDDNLEQT